ncbi:hypothetical protein G9P44_001883 [Scheffersomyces stipitis]|nr:hypothetical protein G9P44_001883 [Scheffersomyces stipitis]
MSSISQEYESEITDVDNFPDLLLHSQDNGDVSAKPVPSLHEESNYLSIESIPHMNGSIPISEVEKQQKEAVNLLSVLSGKQSTKNAHSKRATPKAEIVNETEVVENGALDENETTDDSEISDNLDSSFTEVKSRDFRKDHEVLELERRIYNKEVPTISAKDFFARLKTVKEQPPVKSDSQQVISVDVPPDKRKSVDIIEVEDRTIVDVDEDTPPEVLDLSNITGDLMGTSTNTEDLESKIFGENVKRMTASDIFNSAKPVLSKTKKQKKTVGKPTMMVTLRLRSPILEEIKKYDNPLKTRGNAHFSSSFASNNNSDNDFFSRSSSRSTNSLIVTLKVGPSHLQEIKKYENPLKTKGNSQLLGSLGSSNNNGNNNFFTRPSSKPSSSKTNNKSLFASMMAASKGASKLTPLQKLKELLPPALHKSQFHVIPEEQEFLQRDPHFPFIRASPVEASSCEDLSLLELTQKDAERINSYVMQPVKDISVADLVLERIPDISNIPVLNSIYERFIVNSSKNPDRCLWNDLFRPSSHRELLMAPENKDSIMNWIANSFSRLRTQSLTNPRNIMMKKKKKKQAGSALDGFIVDDDSFLDGSETEEEIFVPLLILYGSSGSCKSSSVYAIMKEFNGYVHEINSGMYRGRKDIYNGLKELSTTQLVHKQNESKTFQQGLILFEDVNYLFEQDKNFWSVVQDILNISRRPIVLTCEDMLNIPKNLIDFAAQEDSIIRLDEFTISRDILQKYLWLCCASQGYDVSTSILEEVSSNSFNSKNYDLRRCLNDLQFLCQKEYADNFNGIIQLTKVEKSKSHHCLELNQFSSNYDLLSESDIISTNSFSQLNYDIIPNELYDVYVIDDSTKLRAPALPFELDVGNYLQHEVSKSCFVSKYSPELKYSFNQLRTEAVSFIGSRSKKLPKFIQDLQTARRALRSASNLSTPGDSPFTSFEELSSAGRTPEPTGIPDTSFVNHIGPTSFVLDLLPICRWWSRLQESFDEVDKNALAEGRQSVKTFLRYRDFQYKSRIIDDSI